MILRGMLFLVRRVRWLVGRYWGRAVLRSYGVRFGRNLRIGSAPLIRRCRGASICIGDDVVILNELAENPAGVSHRTVLAADRPGARIHIGDRVRISGAILYAWQSIDVGDDVFLGAGAAIYDTDFHSLSSSIRTGADDRVAVAPICIGRGAWIGARAMILKGVRIGPGAVVAAGAVVTRDVPACGLVAGVPARLVRTISEVSGDLAA